MRGENLSLPGKSGRILVEGPTAEGKSTKKDSGLESSAAPLNGQDGRFHYLALGNTPIHGDSLRRDGESRIIPGARHSVHPASLGQLIERMREDGGAQGDHVKSTLRGGALTANPSASDQIQGRSNVVTLTPKAKSGG